MTRKRKKGTGLPDTLAKGVENLSGMSMDDVTVHRNSDQPAQLNAYAYARGADIHLKPGQKVHLPHEAWHVAKQAQGRVKPVKQTMGDAVNDDRPLAQTADEMGEAVVACQIEISDPKSKLILNASLNPLVNQNQKMSFQANLLPDAQTVEEKISELKLVLFANDGKIHLPKPVQIECSSGNYLKVCCTKMDVNYLSFAADGSGTRAIVLLEFTKA